MSLKFFFLILVKRIRPELLYYTSSVCKMIISIWITNQTLLTCNSSILFLRTWPLLIGLSIPQQCTFSHPRHPRPYDQRVMLRTPTRILTLMHQLTWLLIWHSTSLSATSTLLIYQISLLIYPLFFFSLSFPLCLHPLTTFSSSSIAKTCRCIQRNIKKEKEKEKKANNNNNKSSSKIIMIKIEKGQ